MSTPKEYYAVECGECHKPIYIKPVLTIEGKRTIQNWPEKMVQTCENPDCLASDVYIPKEVRVVTKEE